MSANKRVSEASVADLAYFIQERGLCDDFVAWYDEEAPIQRLLRKSEAARHVADVLAEGKKRGFDNAHTGFLLDLHAKHPRTSDAKSEPKLE